MKVTQRHDTNHERKEKRKGKDEDRKDVLSTTLGKTGLEDESESMNKGQRKAMTVTCVCVL